MGLFKDFENSMKENFIEMFPDPKRVKDALDGNPREYDRTGQAKQKATAVVQDAVNGAIGGLAPMAPMMAGRRMPRGGEDGPPPPPDNDMEMG